VVWGNVAGAISGLSTFARKDRFFLMKYCRIYQKNTEEGKKEWL
jgi:hypothetical protein